MAGAEQKLPVSLKDANGSEISLENLTIAEKEKLDEKKEPPVREWFLIDQNGEGEGGLKILFTDTGELLDVPKMEGDYQSRTYRHYIVTDDDHMYLNEVKLVDEEPVTTTATLGMTTENITSCEYISGQVWFCTLDASDIEEDENGEEGANPACKVYRWNPVTGETKHYPEITTDCVTIFDVHGDVILHYDEEDGDLPERTLIHRWNKTEDRFDVVYDQPVSTHFGHNVGHFLTVDCMFTGQLSAIINLHPRVTFDFKEMKAGDTPLSFPSAGVGTRSLEYYKGFVYLIHSSTHGSGTVYRSPFTDNPANWNWTLFSEESSLEVD